MEKPRARKPKTIQIKYPAPYSQSWASPEPQKKVEKQPQKKKTKKNASLPQNLFPGCCHRTKPKPLHGSDPYAPHLKYGIFPPTQKSRNTLVASKTKPSAKNAGEHSAASEFLENKDENKKTKRGQVSESDTPLFVIRPIEKKHRRQLSLSETLHMDIKPRKIVPRSPRKHSPVFVRNFVPTMLNTIEY